MSRKPKRSPPDPDDLKAMLREHVSFEINRFRLAMSHWGKPKYGDLADAMIRESCLIHFRLLLDFFYPRKDPELSIYEDVFVSHYLPDLSRVSPELRKLLELPPWLQDYRDQLDWRLAHVTMKRRQFERQPNWKPDLQFAHMERLIVLFLADLPAGLGEFYDPNKQ